MKIKGHRLTVISALVLTVVTDASLLHAQETKEQIIADLESRASTVNSYRADLTMTMDMMGQKMATHGKYFFKKPDKIWMETEMDMGAMKMKQIFISDGKTAWAYQPTMKMVSKFNMEKVTAEMKQGGMGQKAGDISKPFQGFDRESISYVKAEKIGETKVHIYRGSPKSMEMKNMPFAPSKMEMWIGADDGLVRKMIMFNEEGKEMMTQSYSNIEVNVEVAESQFEFTPPEGVQVMDMTEGSINMMKEMKKTPE